MTTVVEAVNATLASPRAEAAVHVGAQVASGFVARILDGMNVWTVLLTLFLGAVLYDQCEFLLLFFFEGGGWTFLLFTPLIWSFHAPEIINLGEILQSERSLDYDFLFPLPIWDSAGQLISDLFLLSHMSLPKTSRFEVLRA
jgi:hypothetical protein